MNHRSLTSEYDNEQNLTNHGGGMQPQPLMGIQVSYNAVQHQMESQESYGIPNWLIKECPKSLMSELIGSPPNPIKPVEENATDDENVSMCLSKSFENSRSGDSPLPTVASEEKPIAIHNSISYPQNDNLIGAIPSLEKFEDQIDQNLEDCIVRLSIDIQDILAFTDEKICQFPGKYANQQEDNIQTRLASLEPLTTAIYDDLCDAGNACKLNGFSFEEKKRRRAKKISEHMPKVLAFLGFNVRQLNMIIASDTTGNSFQKGAIRLTKWFNEILEESDGKWRKIWPQSITTSAFAEILVKYFSYVEAKKHNHPFQHIGPYNNPMTFNNARYANKQETIVASQDRKNEIQKHHHDFRCRYQGCSFKSQKVENSRSVQEGQVIQGTQHDTELGIGYGSTRNSDDIMSGYTIRNNEK